MGVLFFTISKTKIFSNVLTEQICLISEISENKMVAKMCRFTVCLSQRWQCLKLLLFNCWWRLAAEAERKALQLRNQTDELLQEALEEAQKYARYILLIVPFSFYCILCVSVIVFNYLDYEPNWSGSWARDENQISTFHISNYSQLDWFRASIKMALFH